MVEFSLGKSEKEVKLLNTLHSILNCNWHKNEMNYLLKTFQFSIVQVEQEFLDYNLDIFDRKGNSVYNNTLNRIVLHIHNQVENSWHQEKQSLIEDLLNRHPAKSIVDMGFGVPTRYVKNALINNKNISITLSDFSDSAFNFARILLNYWNEGWENKINFLHCDMNSMSFAGEYDIYMFQDSLEHIDHPFEYLTKVINLSSANTRFILSLPIGPLIPRHTIAWENCEDARNWLTNCGLKIDEEYVISVNPKVDLFAEQMDYEYKDLILLCSIKS